ncbi:MAG TPA: NnrU family protein, partial [Kofleriaceae bacterium]|nr:NnrU family protein [Kofleriaceae bacterium]
MSRTLALAYGVVVYLLFGLTWAYFVGFLGGFPVPKDVDSGAIAPWPRALAIDLGCLALFFAHHSVMARARAKRAIARFVPPAIERSTYVLVATLAMILVMAMWRPLPQIVWHAEGAAAAALTALFWTGVVVALASSHMLDGLELFGVRQVLALFRRRTRPSTPFRTPGLYRLVRHPMMTGMLVSFWAVPTMTQGRLLL